MADARQPGNRLGIGKRARLRELESRQGGEFQKELGSFVEEGKLKKTGGVEEVERMRLVREEKARKEVEARTRERMRVKAEKEASGGGGEAGGGGVNGAPPEVAAAEGGEGADGGLQVPEKEGHVIDLQWAIPPQQKLYRASPCGYLGHLLG